MTRAPTRRARSAPTRSSRRSTTTPGRFDTVLDGVGGTVLRDAIHRLRSRGTVVAYGVAGGREPTPLAFYDFAGQPALGRLIGFFVYATGEETFGADLAALAGDGRGRAPARGPRGHARLGRDARGAR